MIKSASKESGRRLAQARERLGLSQQEFADHCGVTRLTQNYYERGKRDPNLEYLRQCQRLGISLDWLGSGAQCSELSETGIAKDLLTARSIEIAKAQLRALEATLDATSEIVVSSGGKPELGSEDCDAA